jgi:hypothetical protein
MSFSKIIKKLSQIKTIGQRIHQSELEMYIQSKNPVSPGDVEHLIRQFNNRTLNRAYY